MCVHYIGFLTSSTPTQHVKQENEPSDINLSGLIKEIDSRILTSEKYELLSGAVWAKNTYILGTLGIYDLNLNKFYF